MSSPETLSAPVSVPDSYKEAPADSVTARTVEAISEDPAVTRKRELIRSEADRLASEAQARMSGPDAPTDPTDPVWIEMRQALSRAEFMRELAAHRNPDVIRILGDRASFAQLISSDFQLLVIAWVDVGSAVLHALDGSAPDLMRLSADDRIKAYLGADSAASGSLLLVDLLPDSAMVSIVAIDGEEYVYREPPSVDEAGFFKENVKNAQIPAVVRDGTVIEIVSTNRAWAGRDRDLRAYRDRVGQTAVNRGLALSDREEDRRIAREFRERQGADRLRQAFMLHGQYGTAVKAICGEGALDIPLDELGGVFTHLLYKESGFRSHIKDTRSSAEGFGQILPSTWAAIEKNLLPRYRERLGLGELVEAGLMSREEAEARPLKFDRANPVHQLLMAAVYLRAMYDEPKTANWAEAVVSYNLPGYNKENFTKVQKARGNDPAKNSYQDYLVHRASMRDYYDVGEWAKPGHVKEPIIVGASAGKKPKKA